MALIEHPTQEYNAVKRDLVAKEDGYFDDYVVCSSILDKFWGSFLTYSELLVLRFIIGRTLLYRKRAESIMVSHFLSGVSGRESGKICHGVNMSENTVRRSIKALQERDLVTVHCFKEGNVECHARLYEVNVEQIAAERNVEEITKLLNRPRKVADLTPPNREGHPSQSRGGLTLLDKSNRNSSTNVELSATSVPTEEVSFLRKPRKPRAVVANDFKKITDPQELIRAISSATKERKNTRAAAASNPLGKKWDTKSVQALLDKARDNAREQGYTVPRVVVVAKNVNVLWKRCAAAELPNALDFFTWALCNWATVASANQRAIANKVKETSTTSTPMGKAPNFNDLAFRCTYFLAFYNSREFTAAEEKRKEASPERRYRSNPEAVATRKAAVAKRDLDREQELRAEDERAAKAVRRMRRSPAKVEIDLDEEIPVFKEREYRA